MAIIDDFILFFKNLNQKNVQYMIIGGYAVNYYGYLRSTFDMDIWLNKEDANLEKFCEALISIGYNKDDSRKAIDYFKDNHMLKIRNKYNVIDVLDSFMVKKEFTKAYEKHQYMKLEDVKIPVIGYDDLIENKYRSNRYKDLNDVKELKAINKEKEKDKGLEM